MKASSMFNFPRACNSAARARKMPSSLPSRTHCWKRRWQVWYGGYLLGSSRHCAPVPNPQDSVEDCSCVRPRTTSTIGASLRSQDRFDQLPLASLSSHRPRMPSFCLFSYTQKIAI